LQEEIAISDRFVLKIEKVREIPIVLPINGVPTLCYLSQVSGAGSSANWHLYVNRFYYGDLFYVEFWKFYGNDPSLSQYAEDMGSAVSSALDALM